MKHKLTLVITILAIAIQSCNTGNSSASNKSDEQINKDAPFYTHRLPEGSPRVTKLYDTAKIGDYFPFIIYRDGSYMVAAEFNKDDRLSKYQQLFEKYDYLGSGYNWAGLIKAILRKEKPELIDHIDLDPEGNAFYLFADSDKSQKEFVEFMSKTFGDMHKIETYLTGPDKDKIENYNPND